MNDPSIYPGRSDPDNVTMELAAYGTQYDTVKTAFYQADAMIDTMEQENAAIIADMDLEFFVNFLDKTFDLLYLPDERIPRAYLDAVRKIRTYVQNVDGIAELRQWRVDIDLWGRMHGAAQYGERMHIRGIPQEIWEMSSHMMNKQPIAFETVREARE